MAFIDDANKRKEDQERRENIKPLQKHKRMRAMIGSLVELLAPHPHAGRQAVVTRVAEPPVSCNFDAIVCTFIDDGKTCFCHDPKLLKVVGKT